MSESSNHSVDSFIVLGVNRALETVEPEGAPASPVCPVLTYGLGVPIVAWWKQIPLASVRMQVRSLALRCCEQWCRSQMPFRSHVTESVTQGSSCSSDSTPSLGTSMCQERGPKEKKKAIELICPHTREQRGEGVSRGKDRSHDAPHRTCCHLCLVQIGWIWSLFLLDLTHSFIAVWKVLERISVPCCLSSQADISFVATQGPLDLNPLLKTPPDAAPGLVETLSWAFRACCI